MMQRLKGLLLPLALLGLVFAIWTFAIAPIDSWREDQIATLNKMARDQSRLEASIARLAAEKQQLEGTGTLDAVWRAEQSGAAAALVQTALGETARENGVALRSISPVPAPNMPLVASIGVRLEAEVPSDRVGEFLLDLEYSDPTLIIQSASLRRLVRPGSEPEFPLLFLQLDVSAPVLIGKEDG